MKWLKVLSIVVISGIFVFLSVSCSGNSDAPTTSTVEYTIGKGTITIDVTGTGNLALSHKQDLAFEMAGTVAEVLVSESETVTKDQELAKLDTAVWDKQVKDLEKALEASKRNLIEKENALVKAQRQISARELSVAQAELDVQTAENNLEKIAEVKEAQDKIDRIQFELDFAEKMLQEGLKWQDQGIDTKYWDTLINGDIDIATGKYNNNGLKGQLAQAKAEKAEILSGSSGFSGSGSSSGSSVDLALQIQNLQLQILQKKRALEDAKIAVEDAQASAAAAALTKSDAEQTVIDAQADLDKAKNLSPKIRAPFDGFITLINVKGGDEVQKGKVAMQIADLNQFEAKILVNENDIFNVSLGAEATVSLDALQGFSYPAKITRIAPLAKVSQGVVNYEVTVELTSLTPGMSAGLFSGRMPSFSSGNLPEGMSQFVFSGTPPAGGQFPMPTGMPSTGGVFQMPAMTSSPGGPPAARGDNAPSAGRAVSSPKLKDGMTATVSIIIQQKKDILLVPNRALSRQGKDTIVKLKNGETTIDQVVVTGVSDFQNTEVLEGLKEGDKVVVTTTVQASSGQSGPGGNMPGMGRAVVIR